MLMAGAGRLSKTDLFKKFAELDFVETNKNARAIFDKLQELSESELKRCGEFVLPGMAKLVRQERKARMGRNPATGQEIQIPAKTVVKARIAKQLKNAVL